MLFPESIDTQKLSLFFNYVLDLKLGKITSYCPSKTISPAPKQHNEMEQRISLISAPQIPKKSSERMISQSMNLSTGSHKFTRQKTNNLRRISQQPEQRKQVHYGYCCDNCYIDPIVGERYHCELCDYDLCSECYSRNEQLVDGTKHEHLLKKVDKNPDIDRSRLQVPNISLALRLHLKDKLRLTKSSNIGSSKV